MSGWDTFLRSSLIGFSLLVFMLLWATSDVKANGTDQREERKRERGRKEVVVQDTVNEFETIRSFGIYKDNYFIVGSNFSGGKITKYNSDAKFQISLRHRLFQGFWKKRMYMFITYTQKSYWDIFQKSAPFAENNYNPTLGINYPLRNGKKIAGALLLQYEHESNGRDSIWSRSWNKISFMGIYGVSKNFNIQAKFWIPVTIAKENKNIIHYAGFGHVAVSYNDNNERFRCSALLTKRGGWNLNANITLEVAYRFFRGNNQYFFIQYHNGYGESLIEYNEFRNYLRLGFVIKPKFLTIF